MNKRKRKPPQGRKMKPTFFVFCEGKTEELYVKYLKSKYRIPIEIDTKIAKNKITAKYIKSYKEGKFTHSNDKTFLLYDLDAPKMLEKLQAIPNTILLSSNPCIEFWYLLHYKEHKANIDCKSCNKELERRNKKYDKTSLDNKLKKNLETEQEKAVNRAKKLKHYENPSSTVYLLIDELERISKNNK